MNFDFHCHSSFSDGALSPQDLADYAVVRRVELLALTDHDSITGINVIKDYITAHQLPLRIVEGVEISALTDFGEIHIVGLDIDSTCLSLRKRLAAQRQQRWQRAEDIDSKLAKIGVVGVFQQVKTSTKQVVTRTHIAKAIVKLGFAKDMQQAFKRYIGKQGKIKVTKNWMPMDEAIQLIKQAGGIPVLAHPTRYPLSNNKLSLLIQAFKSEGGEGLELAYPSLNRDKLAWLKIHLQRNQLLASSGSDFHYPDLRWTDLGQFPMLDANIPHVLQKLNIPEQT